LSYKDSAFFAGGKKRKKMNIAYFVRKLFIQSDEFKITFYQKKYIMLMIICNKNKNIL